MVLFTDLETLRIQNFGESSIMKESKFYVK